MNNQKRLFESFAKALEIPIENINDGLAYNSISQWDSVTHMRLISELELTFDVMLDTDDIIDMSSVAKAREILAKYGVNFS